MARGLGAFLSYAHLNDEHDGGRLTQLSAQLEREVRVQTAQSSFKIFVDTDVHWGEPWRQRIEQALDSARFLIPVITPGYLSSKECRREFERFLERERRVGTGDLIFPLMYVDTPAVTASVSRTRDPVALEIRKREYVSWVDLRFEPWTNAAVGARLAKLANMIGGALRTGRRSRSESTGHGRRPLSSERILPSASRTSVRSDKSILRASSRTGEPPTIIVDPLPKRGDHTSVQAAVTHAAPGARVLVRPGFYRGGLVLDKPLEIIGEGSQEDIIIEAVRADALVFNTNFGRVANLTLRQNGGGRWYGVDIAQGRLELEDCDISSKSLACVAIHGGADPRLRRNRIHDGQQTGVLAYDDARGTLEENEISGNGFSGIEITAAADPVVRRNRIHDNVGLGVYVYNAGRGTFEENDMFGHDDLPAAMITEGGNPIFRRNLIHHNDGLFIHSRGRGVFEGNEIFETVGAGVGVSEAATPTFRRNRIHNCRSSGVFVYDGGQPIFQDNDIYENSGAGVEVRAASQVRFRANRILRNGYEGVWVYSGGGGVFEQNRVADNAMGTWAIDRASRRKIRRDDEVQPASRGHREAL